MTLPGTRVCSGCGATAAGIRPVGWLIVPLERYVVGAGVSMVVGERPLCPDCRGAGDAAVVV